MSRLKRIATVGATLLFGATAFAQPGRIGLMRYLADAATFTDCASGRTVPVVIGEGDWLTAERAYAVAREAARLDGGAPIKVHIEAVFADRAPMEGARRGMLVVQRFGGVVGAAGEGCGAPAALIGPVWRLRELTPGEAVAPLQGPPVQLAFDSTRVAGFTGCNQTSAGYTVEGPTLRLAPAISARRACLDAQAAAVEARLHAAMAAVTRWQISGNQLDWFDVKGERMVRFETPADPGITAWRDEVFAAERAFARSMAERDGAAFARHLDEEAVFFGGAGTVLRGKAAVVAGWSSFFQGPQAPFSWDPDQVEVLAGGTLALSTGQVRDPQGQVVGRFNSIWRRAADGRWLVVFDKGGPPDPPSR
jgi:ketosteroid isomerase-like protein/heat shock protein HslJ